MSFRLRSMTLYAQCFGVAERSRSHKYPLPTTELPITAVCYQGIASEIPRNDGLLLFF
ncbi:MAG: hypothetical protein LBN23_02415 [Paludibacter sp.]|nr:hypothetical protein [Paludibacter sp.]